jgi:hypothetical protein
MRLQISPQRNGRAIKHVRSRETPPLDRLLKNAPRVVTCTRLPQGDRCRVPMFRAGIGVKVSGGGPGTCAECQHPQTRTNMPIEEWIKALEDGRLVKFTNEKLPGGGSFITAQIEKNEVVYSIVVDNIRNPLSRNEVEGRFKAELSKK